MSQRSARFVLAFLLSLSPSLSLAQSGEPRSVQDAVEWIDEAAYVTTRSDPQISAFLEETADAFDEIAPAGGPPVSVPVDGLAVEIETSTAKIPGMHKFTDVTLKRGVVSVVVNLELVAPTAAAPGQGVRLRVDAFDRLPVFHGDSLVIELD